MSASRRPSNRKRPRPTTGRGRSGPTGGPTRPRRRSPLLDEEWQVDWDVATIEPSLHESVTLDLVTLGADARATSWAPAASRWSPIGPWSASASTARKVGPAKAGASAARARPAGRRRRGGVRQAGGGRRPARLRRGHRVPPGRGAAGRAARRRRHQGRRDHRRHARRWRRPRTSRRRSSARSAR